MEGAGVGAPLRPSSTTAGPVFVATRDNMLVSGGAGTGKTMLPNALVPAP